MVGLRLPRWLAVAIFVALLLAMTAPAARAQEETPDYITNVTITSVTVDLNTGVPTLTGSVTCLVDVQFLRIRATLTQRSSSSFQTVERSCAAGEIKSLTIVFGPQQGRFSPGAATLSGFVEAYAVCCTPPSDLESFPVQRVILRPS